MPTSALPDCYRSYFNSDSVPVTIPNSSSCSNPGLGFCVWCLLVYGFGFVLVVLFFFLMKLFANIDVGSFVPVNVYARKCSHAWLIH